LIEDDMTDVSFAVSETAFKAVFNKVYPSVVLPFDGSTSAGPIWLGVEGEIHINGAGDIDFEDRNTFLLKELDIGWDKLVLRLGFDLPTITIGKFCLLRVPDNAPFLAGECLFEFPGGDIFEGAPDIGPIKLNLNAIISFLVSEISGRYSIGTEKKSDHIEVKAYVQALDVDPISINDTFGQLPSILQAGIAACAASVVSKIPQAWLLDAALGLVGFPSVTEWLLDLLDIEDDVEEWLMDKLNLSIGIDNLLYQIILDQVLEKVVFKIKDPYPIETKINANIADFGGFTDPQPTGTQFTIPTAGAPIVNPSAVFDEDYLWIRFDFGL
jgi:hypothetical protein